MMKYERVVAVSSLLPQPDLRSRPAYTVLAVLAASAWVLLAITGLQIGVAFAWAFCEVAALGIFVAWMLRRAGHSSISTALETVFLAYLFTVAGLVIQAPLMALPLPFTDALLSRADHALGFDWWAFTQLFGNRWLWGAMFVSYASIIPQTFVLLTVLSATDRHDRAWQFVTASSLALAVTMLIMPFFPADGSLALCSLKPGSPWLAPGVCDYGPVIHQLKDGQITVLAGNALMGMVSFPSFHTAIALQFMWGFWPYRWLRWPMVIINSASAVVRGVGREVEADADQLGVDRVQRVERVGRLAIDLEADQVAFRRRARDGDRAGERRLHDVGRRRHAVGHFCAVPNAASSTSSSLIATPWMPQMTLPVPPGAAQMNCAVTVLSFHDLGIGNMNCACSASRRRNRASRA
jgi:hypothetical protein